jgi:hypothetical protein
MDFKDYILNYKVDDKIVADLFDYYDMYIKNLDKRFEQYSYHASDLVLCFFKDHEDINPSMGYMRDKQHKGGKVCHCFGCGRTADVIRLHQILRSSYENVELTEKESCIEVATMFKIPIEDFDELDDEDYEAKYLRTLRKIDKLKNHYTIRDFSSEVLNIRKNNEDGIIDLNRLNSACVKMIATDKQLYN